MWVECFDGYLNDVDVLVVEVVCGDVLLFLMGYSMGGVVVVFYVIECVLVCGYGLIGFVLLSLVFVLGCDVLCWMFVVSCVISWVWFMFFVIRIDVVLLLCDLVVVVVNCVDLFVYYGVVFVCIGVEIFDVMVCIENGCGVLWVLVFVYYGIEDKLIEFDGSCVFGVCVGLFDCMLMLYEGGFYEMMNDFECDCVIDVLIVWIYVCVLVY